MSTTIDQRVVEMRFDNAQFESNVATTMSTVGRLKQSLNFGDTANMVGLKFNAMYTYADQTMRSITNTVNYHAKRIASALTIDPIISGFDEYETKINAIQTIMSNTASKGTTMEDVTRVIGELNTYADKTIYNFAEMTRNIGTFTAAGVGLEESAAAIQGIANLAAASGSTSQQASTAMYQLSQALASGTVKLMDWNSVVNAGMGGEKFQNALKATAKEHGVAIDDIIKKQGSFRESLSEGWLTADILNETLQKFTVEGAKEYAKSMVESGKYTQEQADALIKEAQAMEDAATKVKTFTQLWSTLCESAQSGWSQTWEIIVGDFEEAKELLTKVSDVIGGMIGKSADARNEMLEYWKELGGRADLIKSIENAFEGILNIIRPIKEAFNEIFPPMTAGRLLDATQSLLKFTETFRDKFKEGSKAAENLKRTFKGLFAIIDIGVMAVKAIGNGLLSLVDAIAPVGDGVLGLTAWIGDCATALRDYIKANKIFERAISTIVGILKPIIRAVYDFTKNVILAFRDMSGISIDLIESLVSRMKARFGSLGDLGKAIGTAFASTYRYFKDIFSSLFPLVESIFNMVHDLIINICEEISGGNFDTAMDLLNAALTGGLGALIITLTKYMGKLEKGGLIKALFGNSLDNLVKSVNKVLDGVTGAFKAFTQSIKADTLMKLAKAIGILSLALIGLSLIDSDDLTKSLGAITALFAELFIGLGLLNKMLGVGKTKANSSAKGVTKFVETLKNEFRNPLAEMAPVLIGVAAAVLMLSFAMAKVAKIDPERLTGALVAIMLLVYEVSYAMYMLSKGDQAAVVKGTRRILAIGTAVSALSVVLTKVAELSWSELARGVIGLTTCTVLLVGMMKAISQVKKLPMRSLSAMIGVSVALVSMTIPLKVISTMNWGSLIKGLVGMAGCLTLVLNSFRIMDGFEKSILEGAGAMLVASVALTVMSGVMKILASFKWEELGKAAVGLVIAVGSMVGAFLLLDTCKQSILHGAGAMLVMSTALLLFVPSMAMLGAMSWTSIVKGLVAIAGAFAVMGAAGYILGGLAPVILMLAASLALLGVSVLTVGVGIAAFATGLMIFAAAAMAMAGSIKVIANVLITLVTSLIVGILKGIGMGIVALCEVIITSAKIIGEAIKTVILELCDVVMTCLPTLVETVLKLIVGLLEGIVKYTPKIVDAIFNFILAILEGVANNIPKIILAVADIIAAIFEGAIEVFARMDHDAVAKGLMCVGLMAGVMAALSAVAALVPTAIIGATGMGIVMVHLANVLSLLGIFEELVGASDFIEKGGELLEAIGTAIGRLLGGIAGGIMQGVTSSLPAVGEDLSNFMKNAEYFIDKASSIDGGLVDGVMTLVKTILAITGANIIQGITSFITGGRDVSTFATQLGILGMGLQAFSLATYGVDADNVKAAAGALSELSAMSESIPKLGGLVSLFEGENSMALFAAQLPLLGAALQTFSLVTYGVKPENVKAAAGALSELASMNESIPKMGGLVSLFEGENRMDLFAAQLPLLGAGLWAFAQEVEGIKPEIVTAASQAVSELAKMTEVIPNQDGIVAWFTGDNNIGKWGTQLPVLGAGLLGFSLAAEGVNVEKVTAAASAAKALAEVTKIIPNQDGIVAWFTGDNSIDKWAMQLPVLGAGLMAFSVATLGIIPDNIKAAAEAVKAIADAASVIPNQGGIVALFVGDNSLASLAWQFPILGAGLMGLSVAVMGIIPENIEAAATATKLLAEAASVIPNQGGLVALFSGDNSLAAFSGQFPVLGAGLLAFSIAVTGLNKAAVENGIAAAKSLVDLSHSIPSGEGILAWFGADNSVANFGAQLGALGKGLHDFQANLGEDGIDKTKVEGAAAAATAIAAMTEHIPKSEGIAAWFKNTTVEEFGSQLGALGKGVSAFAEATTSIESANDVEPAAQAAIAIARMMEAMPDKVKDVKTFGTNLEKLSEKLKKYFKNVSGITEEQMNMSTGAMSAIKDVSTINAANVKAVAEGITDLAKAAKNLAKNVKSDLKEAGKDAINGFISGIKNKLSDAKTAAKTIVTDSADAIEDKASSFETAGKAVVQGFADGIDKNTYIAEAKAKAMATAAYQAAKEALKVNSPSKKFRELGYSIPEGMALGIDRLAGIVSKSAVAMGDDAIGGVQKSITRIGDLINTDIDSQPTIRPVLDLSDVMAGANEIDNLFDTRSPVGVLANIGAINSEMNRRNQNGGNSDVVSAIDKLHDAINNINNNTYHIDGITYDDGSNISDAVQSLIRATRVGRRV